MPLRIALIAASAAVSLACAPEAVGETRPNLLVIVADDLGCRDIGVYGDLWENPDPPPTPAIDGLAARGIRFERMHANPTCSPTRVTLLYGMYSHRVHIGGIVKPDDEHDTPTTPFTSAATWLGRAGYATGYFGKWHLSAGDEEALARAPLEHGFDTYRAGSVNQKNHYFDWERSDDGVIRTEERYSLTAQADACRDWIEARPEGEPWFACLSVDAPHSPIHVPPPSSLPPGYRVENSPRGWYDAIVAALDHTVGGVLEAVDLTRTTVVFLSDNGPGKEALLPQQDPERIKGSLYREGIVVPFVIAGFGVEQPGGSCSALANTADLFATLADLAGAPLDAGDETTAPDSVSLVPFLADPNRESLRDWALSERFGPNGPPPHRSNRRALITERYKYLRINATEEFYDLELDPEESVDLVGTELSAEQSEQLARHRSLLELQVGPYAWRR